MCHDHLYHNTHWFFTFHPHEEFLLSFKSISRFIFLERGDEKRCLSCPGQGPASRALTLKVSPCAVLQKKAKCSDRAQDASCFTGKRKWFPGAQTQQQPLHRLSWVCSCHAQLLKCPFPTGRAMMETELGPDPPSVLIRSRWASSAPHSTQRGGNHRLQQREAETEGGIPFPQYTRDDVLMEFTDPRHLQRSARKLNEVCTPNSSPLWDLQLPQQISGSRTNHISYAPHYCNCGNNMDKDYYWYIAILNTWKKPEKVSNNISLSITNQIFFSRRSRENFVHKRHPKARAQWDVRGKKVIKENKSPWA